MLNNEGMVRDSCSFYLAHLVADRRGKHVDFWVHCSLSSADSNPAPIFNIWFSSKSMAQRPVRGQPAVLVPPPPDVPQPRPQHEPQHEPNHEQAQQEGDQPGPAIPQQQNPDLEVIFFFMTICYVSLVYACFFVATSTHFDILLPANLFLGFKILHSSAYCFLQSLYLDISPLRVWALTRYFK